MKGSEIMIKVTARNYIKEELVGEFLEITKELVEKTNALDMGCIKYELCRNIDDPLNYVMLEEWEDQASLDEHMKATHFVELVPKLGALGSKPSELTILEKVY